MSGTLEIPELHVEGGDDIHTIIHLLRRHSVNMDDGVRPIVIVPAKNVDQLLENVPRAIKAATSRPVGFVVDIDVPIMDRWAQVRNRLREAQVDAPDQCPPSGFIGRRRGYPSDVGVWLMPDCTTDRGKLEDLLTTLIPNDNKLWPHARTSTDEAKKIGAAFGDADRDKASIHAWLAWQKEPGLPFGTAIKAKFFNDDSPQALAFLRWLKRLYGIAQLVSM